MAPQTVMVLLALCANAVHAQIALDNTSASAGDTATLSFHHAVNSGADPLLMVGVEVHSSTKVTAVQWGTGPANCSSTCEPASCLCALSRVGAVTNGNEVTVQLWALLRPPPGAGNIVISLPSSHRLVSGATSFFGVDQTTPLGAAATDSGTGDLASVSVSSATGEIVLDAVGTNPSTKLKVVGTGETQQYQASSNTVAGAGSTAPGAPMVTMSWSLPTPASWAMVAVSINPAPTPTSGPPTPTPSPTPTPCAGDCWDSGNVSVDALLTLANIALGEADISSCMAGDANLDGQITINEIVAAVNNALSGCPNT